MRFLIRKLFISTAPVVRKAGKLLYMNVVCFLVSVLEILSSTAEIPCRSSDRQSRHRDM